MLIICSSKRLAIKLWNWTKEEKKDDQVNLQDKIVKKRLLLYEVELTTRFSHFHSPPREIGITWSMVKSWCEEQYLQIKKKKSYD